MSHAPALWPDAPPALAAELHPIDSAHDLGQDVFDALETLISRSARVEPRLMRAQVCFDGDDVEGALLDLGDARASEGASLYAEWIDCLAALCEETSAQATARALAAGASAIARRPLHYYSLRCMAAACHTAEDFESALRHHQSARQLWPNGFAVHNRLLHLLGRCKREQEIPALIQGRDIPMHGWGMAIEYNAGTLLFQAGRYDEAIAFLDVARQRMGPVNNVQHNRGLCLEELGRYQEAVDEWSELIAREPDWDWPRQGRGRCLVHLGAYERAAADLKHLQKISPRHASTMSLDVLLHFEQKQHEQTLRALRAYDEVHGVDSEYLLNLRGITLSALDRREEAEKDLLKAIEARPDSYRAHRSLIENWLGDDPPRRTQARKALPYAQAALALRPHLWEAHDLYIRVQSTLGHDSEVVRCHEDWIARHPDDDRAMQGLGTWLMDRGQHVQALMQFEAARRVNPSNLYALWGQGKCLGQLGRTDEARRCLNDAMQRYQMEGQTDNAQACQRSLDALNQSKGWLSRLWRR